MLCHTLLLLPLFISATQDSPSKPSSAATLAGFDPAATLLAAGREALANGDLGSATQRLREALELAPGEAEIRLLLARTLNDRGLGAQSLALLEPQEVPPPSAWLAVERGRALQAGGSLEGARQSFHVALASYPACGAARLELGLDHLASGELEAAHAMLEPLLAAAPSEPAVIIASARLFEAEGHEAQAIALLTNTVERDAGALPLRLALARLLLAAQRAEEAWITVEPLLDAQLDTQTLLYIARVAERADHTLEALAVLGTALTVDPTHPEVLHDLLELMEDASLLIERIAKRRIEGNPADVYGWEELLQEYLVLGRCEEVLTALRSAPEAVLADREVRLHEASALRRLGRVDEAHARLLELAQGGEAEVLYELGLLEYAMGQFAAAQAAFTSSATGDFAADAHYNRGLCARKLEQHAAAAQAFEAALAARPDFIEAWLELGRECRYRLGDAPRARRAFKRYLELGGDDAEIRRWLEEVQ